MTAASPFSKQRVLKFHMAICSRTSEASSSGWMRALLNAVSLLDYTAICRILESEQVFASCVKSHCNDGSWMLWCDDLDFHGHYFCYCYGWTTYRTVPCSHCALLFRHVIRTKCVSASMLIARIIADDMRLQPLPHLMQLLLRTLHDLNFSAGVCLSNCCMVIGRFRQKLQNRYGFCHFPGDIVAFHSLNAWPHLAVRFNGCCWHCR